VVPGRTASLDATVWTFGAASATVVSVVCAHGAVYDVFACPCAIDSW